MLEPGAELPEGAEVRVEVTDLTALDPIFDFSDLAVETGIPDLATNVDHYLYGHPKKDDA
ncbi:MAG TPA: hypothetical protein VF017_16810 [Thermoanaerobaculia bacterium]|nr:hypothetical protein [Thermoanaerobaculia bacterium]